MKKNFQPRLIGKMENILAIISEKFGDGMGYNNNLYLVIASRNHEKNNPLIIGVMSDIVMMNDGGMITEMNNEYENYTHHMFMMIKLFATT